MICASCGTVGAPEATWCPQCFMPYVRAGARPPVVPTVPASRSEMPWQSPAPVPAQPQPQQPAQAFAAPTHAPPSANAFAGPPPYAPAQPGFSQPGRPQPGYPPHLGFPAPAWGPPQPGYPPQLGSPAPAWGPPQQSLRQPAAQVWPAKLGLVVPEYAVAIGDLPRICVISGRPTENMRKMRWQWAPAWTIVFALLGIWPVFIVRALVGHSSAGYLPVHPAVWRKRSLLTVSGLLAILAGFVTMVGGAVNNSGPVCMVGVAAMVGGIVAAIKGGRMLPVRRAAEGFLALPKASPAFTAAFNAGRPAHQRPYSETPITFRTSKGIRIAGAVCVAILVPAAIYGAVRDRSCQQAAQHPNAGAALRYLNASDAAVDVVTGHDAGNGMTDVEAQQQLTSDRQLEDSLSSVSLGAADSAARNSYLVALGVYDRALQAALSGSAPNAESQVAAAATALSQADSRMHTQLSGVGDAIDCASN